MGGKFLSSAVMEYVAINAFQRTDCMVITFYSYLKISKCNVPYQGEMTK